MRACFEFIFWLLKYDKWNLASGWCTTWRYLLYKISGIWHLIYNVEISQNTKWNLVFNVMNYHNWFLLYIWLKQIWGTVYVNTHWCNWGPQWWVPWVPAWNPPFEGLPSCMVSKTAHANITTYTTHRSHTEVFVSLSSTEQRLIEYSSKLKFNFFFPRLTAALQPLWSEAEPRLYILRAFTALETISGGLISKNFIGDMSPNPLLFKILDPPLDLKQVKYKTTSAYIYIYIYLVLNLQAACMQVTIKTAWRQQSELQAWLHHN